MNSCGLSTARAVSRRELPATRVGRGAGRRHAQLPPSDERACRGASQAGQVVILLLMQGGPSQFETFDPKPGTENGGQTKAIDTAVSGIQIAEQLDQTRQADERHRPHPLGDQQRRPPPARHVPAAHRLRADRQRAISRASARSSPSSLPTWRVICRARRLGGQTDRGRVSWASIRALRRRQPGPAPRQHPARVDATPLFKRRLG